MIHSGPHCLFQPLRWFMDNKDVHVWWDMGYFFCNSNVPFGIGAFFMVFDKVMVVVLP